MLRARAHDTISRCQEYIGTSTEVISLLSFSYSVINRGQVELQVSVEPFIAALGAPRAFMTHVFVAFLFKIVVVVQNITDGCDDIPNNDNHILNLTASMKLLIYSRFKG